MKKIHSGCSLPRKLLSTFLFVGILLFFSLNTAVAQDISWTPLSMSFPDVPYGTTETRTLTITNDDSTDPVSIDNIEWTFMSYYDPFGDPVPAFSYTADRLVPATLLPGTSMDIEISFSPVDDGVMSFVSANLLITNTSANAASLNYWLDGNGTDYDPCYPLSFCDGICQDLSSDLENCGQCNNVCSIPENGTAFCEEGTCGFTCDEGYEPVGNGCQLIVIIPETLEEQMDALLLYATQAKEDGTLVGLGPGASGPAKLDVFINRLALSQEWISFGTPETLAAACGSLNFNQLRCDGGWPFIMPPDFVAGEAASEIYDRILSIMALIEGCEITDAPKKPRQ